MCIRDSSRATVIDRYAAASGRSLEHLSWHLGLAYFKLGAIAGGIAARVRAGAMAGQDFGDVDQEVVVSATQGLAALDRY